MDRIMPFSQFTLDCTAEMALENFLFSTAKGREKVKDSISKIDTAINAHLTMIEKFIPLITNYMKSIDRVFNTREEAETLAKAFNKAAVGLDYDRGTTEEMKSWSKAYVKYYRSKVFNRADYKKEDVSEAELALIKKICKGGAYHSRLIKCVDGLEKAHEQLVALIEKWKKTDGNDWTKAAINMAIDEYNWFIDQVKYTDGDMLYVARKSKIKVDSASESFTDSFVTMWRAHIR